MPLNPRLTPAPPDQSPALRDLQQGVKEAVLAARHFEGLQEPISFDAFGDVRRKLFVTVVRDGRFALVR